MIIFHFFATLWIFSIIKLSNLNFNLSENKTTFDLQFISENGGFLFTQMGTSGIDPGPDEIVHPEMTDRFSFQTESQK